jgi:catechol 2,3-dioxygenase
MDRSMSDRPWPLHSVTLKVLDLPAQIAFYRQFGFQLATDSSPSSATLIAGDVQLNLIALTNGKPRPPRTAELFHFAILLSDRNSLGSFVGHAARHRWDFVGAADHLVSEALYFSDPEGNGIEVYADRPHKEWQWQDGKVAMDTLPLDLESLAALDSPEWSGFPSATSLGHIHLTVSDLDVSQSFYQSLGLHLTANWGTFRFLAWDNYHHHVAINLLAGPHAAPVTPQISGLASFSIRQSNLPNEKADPSNFLVVPLRA